MDNEISQIRALLKSALIELDRLQRELKGQRKW